MGGRTTASKIALAVAALAVTSVALAFWMPGFRLTGGFPVPLDDVYIYFGFARATALGHPLSWSLDTGFSSGATSLLYPLLLAPLWALGLRGPSLAYGAGAIAIVCAVDAARQVAKLAPRGAARPWLALAAPLAFLAWPLANWSLFSGMETALFAALLARALVQVASALEAPPEARRRAQLRAGAWLALLPLARPEAAVLSLVLGVAVAHGAGALATTPSLARAVGPLAIVLAGTALLFRAFTGEWQAAGAIRKLLTADPHLAPEGLVLEVAKNLVVLAHQGIFRATGGALGMGALAVLVALAVSLKGRRRVSVALVTGSLGALLLVSLNATARYQNYRYIVPSLFMLGVVAWLGLGALARRGKLARLVALGLAVAWVVAPLAEWPRQIAHHARASRNIAEQQGVVAARLRALEPTPVRVMVGDAGAIPYLSELPALDGLGLGGYRDLPFARASLFGDDAVIELVERMPPSERPDVLAVYPGWWPELTRRFGTRFDSVRIVDNVICAADEKVLYRADFRDLGAPEERAYPDAEDELDVADLVDEGRHRLAFDRDGDRVLAATRVLADGRPRWDGGRRVAPEGALRFFARLSSGGALTLVLRTDQEPPGDTDAVVEVRHGGRDGVRTPLTAHACTDARRYCELGALLHVEPDDEIILRAGTRELRVLRAALIPRAR